MPEHQVGTREEWEAAREELRKSEDEHAERSEELARQRRELPWVPVEKEYSFDTDEGTKTWPSSSTDARSCSPQHHVRPGVRSGLPRLLESRGPPRRRACPPQPPRRHLALLLASAAGEAPGLQAADGLEVPLGVDLRKRLSVRLRPRSHRGADGGHR
jgi:Bacterial protein of unknown function (DUF899)